MHELIVNDNDEKKLLVYANDFDYHILLEVLKLDDMKKQSVLDFINCLKLNEQINEEVKNVRQEN